MGVAKEHQTRATQKVALTDFNTLLVDQTKGPANPKIGLRLSIGIGEQ